ncbi:hypothetical protein B0H16DRAFT_1469277 [Mycena metata]|uniref:Uncharacterized protein n=1 Tax=Mycena metata TaxID=1033252 RepID=A0AAD7MTA4_9AGAR|nr:hypothetical protein B0H16DRAFT_1469277 [Mycena metata]
MARHVGRRDDARRGSLTGKQRTRKCCSARNQRAWCKRRTPRSLMRQAHQHEDERTLTSTRVLAQYAGTGRANSAPVPTCPPNCRGRRSAFTVLYGYISIGVDGERSSTAGDATKTVGQYPLCAHALGARLEQAPREPGRIRREVVEDIGDRYTEGNRRLRSKLALENEFRDEFEVAKHAAKGDAITGDYAVEMGQKERYTVAQVSRPDLRCCRAEGVRRACIELQRPVPATSYNTGLQPDRILAASDLLLGRMLATILACGRSRPKNAGGTIIERSN